MKHRLTSLIPYVGPTIVVVAVVASLTFSDPHSIRRVFLANIAIVALATVILVVREDTVGKKWGAALPWLLVGALLSGALLGPMALAPWVALAALTCAFAARLQLPSAPQRRLLQLGLIAAGATVNGVILWLLLLGGYRPLPLDEFEAKPLRAHTLLADVPLHDTWSIRLRGAESDLSISEVGAVLGDRLIQPPNAAVAALAATRALLGWVFRWEAQDCSDPATSYVHRLSEADRARSVRAPEQHGFVYIFEREALLEITNCTVQAFLSMSLETADDGQHLIVGVHVMETQDITPYYMALIDPFRRLIVYPVVIDHIERLWAGRVQSAD